MQCATVGDKGLNALDLKEAEAAGQFRAKNEVGRSVSRRKEK